ncbi:MAG: SAM-dependent methyltransferase [Bacteroidetes bacterium]|nr:SAM-dependent methyltransferase [Bacteroidota bacterium]
MVLLKTKSSGILYLIPNVIANEDSNQVNTGIILPVLQKISVLFAEDLRNARRFIRSLDPGFNLERLVMHSIGKHADMIEISGVLSSLPEGSECGLISEAGMPCIADPGNIIVMEAHRIGMRVIPIQGPNSIILALAASGFSGQKFAFHGYLPVNRNERIQSIREIESNAYKLHQTQIFMETPFRNNTLLDDILKTCRNETILCIAANITASNEYIQTAPVREWKNKRPDLHKQPAIFLIYKNDDFF